MVRKSSAEDEADRRLPPIPLNKILAPHIRVPPETRNGRAKGGYGLWQGASGAHTPQWVCKPRATPPEAITTVRPTGCASFSQRQRAEAKCLKRVEVV